MTVSAQYELSIACFIASGKSLCERHRLRSAPPAVIVKGVPMSTERWSFSMVPVPIGKLRSFRELYWEKERLIF